MGGLGERYHEALPLPWHHELHQLLPEGLGPSEGHCAPEGSGRRALRGWLEGHHGAADWLEQGPGIWDDVQLRAWWGSGVCGQFAPPPKVARILHKIGTLAVFLVGGP